MSIQLAPLDPVYDKTAAPRTDSLPQQMPAICEMPGPLITRGMQPFGR